MGRVSRPRRPPGVHQRKDLTLDAAGGARTEITDITRCADAGRGARGNGISRPQRRDADGFQLDHDLAGEMAGRNPRRRMGFVARPRAVSRRGGRRRAASRWPARRCASTLFTRKTFSYRKRLVGGFYAYENTTETRRAGELCSGTTDQRGLLLCDAKPALTGSVEVQAAVSDDAGNSGMAYTEIYIPGDGALVVRGPRR